MKKYYGIDWLRTMACIGIAAMHMRVNNNYSISGFIYDRMVNSFTDFVFLFMAVSAFGMCCGYYNKVMSRNVDWEQFYRKRYIKILPFFALLIVIDLISSFSFNSLMEAITELTLLHGFIPIDLKVIGVGWFLGTVFVFYLIFPFFCVIISNKKRAWFVFFVSIILNYICTFYYGLDRHNFICSYCFFMVGGLIYIYREKIEKVKWQYIFVIMLISLVGYYGNINTLTRLLVTTSLLTIVITAPLPSNKVISFVSGISMEVYLCHMFIFRILEKVHLNYVFGSGLLQYFFIVVVVFIGACFFSYFSQKLIGKLLIKVNLK